MHRKCNPAHRLSSLVQGTLEGKRSSRLNIQYRIIYSVEKEIVSVYVIDITPHEY
jgi:plasmid maintenance system killer protein